jgi:hypothetical protein
MEPAKPGRGPAEHFITPLQMETVPIISPPGALIKPATGRQDRQEMVIPRSTVPHHQARQEPGPTAIPVKKVAVVAVS